MVLVTTVKCHITLHNVLVFVLQSIWLWSSAWHQNMGPFLKTHPVIFLLVFSFVCCQLGWKCINKKLINFVIKFVLCGIILGAWSARQNILHVRIYCPPMYTVCQSILPVVYTACQYMLPVSICCQSVYAASQYCLKFIHPISILSVYPTHQKLLPACEYIFSIYCPSIYTAC